MSLALVRLMGDTPQSQPPSGSAAPTGPAASRATETAKKHPPVTAVGEDEPRFCRRRRSPACRRSAGDRQSNLSTRYVSCNRDDRFQDCCAAHRLQARLLRPSGRNTTNLVGAADLKGGCDAVHLTHRNRSLPRGRQRLQVRRRAVLPKRPKNIRQSRHLVRMSPASAEGVGVRLADDLPGTGSQT